MTQNVLQSFVSCAGRRSTLSKCASGAINKRVIIHNKPNGNAMNVKVVGNNSMIWVARFLKVIISPCECGYCACISWDWTFRTNRSVRSWIYRLVMCRRWPANYEKALWIKKASPPERRSGSGWSIYRRWAQRFPCRSDKSGREGRRRRWEVRAVVER